MSILNLFKRNQANSQSRHADLRKKEAEKYLDMGVQFKRGGNLGAAHSAYWKAIELDPKNAINFYSLAKTCYLMNRGKEAISGYLATLHLSITYIIWDVEKDANSVHRMIRAQIEARNDPSVLASIRKFHPYADMVYVDPNTPCHLGHAIVDLNTSISKSARAQKAIETYRTALSGKPCQTDQGLDDEFYIPLGQEFALNNLQWKSVGKSLDIQFYFQTEDFRMSTIPRI